jgi:hypothetical protein
VFLVQNGSGGCSVNQIIPCTSGRCTYSNVCSEADTCEWAHAGGVDEPPERAASCPSMRASRCAPARRGGFSGRPPAVNRCYARQEQQ